MGVPARGDALAREVEARLRAAADDARARIDEGGGDLPCAAFLYLRGETVQQVAGNGSGVDALLAAAGAVDVGTEMGIDEFAPLTEEALIEAAPDVIVVTTSGLESVGGRDTRDWLSPSPPGCCSPLVVTTTTPPAAVPARAAAPAAPPTRRRLGTLWGP